MTHDEAARDDIYMSWGFVPGRFTYAVAPQWINELVARSAVDPVALTTGAQVRESERLLRLARGTYLGRVVVADRAFLQDVELPQSDRRRTAVSNQSTGVDGEPWS